MVLQIFFFLCVIFTQPLWAQNGTTEIQIEKVDPANLSRNWWTSLEPSIGDKQTTQPLIESLKKQIFSFSKENHAEAQKLIGEIEQNLETLRDLPSKGKNAELISPIATSYSLDRLLELHHHLLKNKIEIQIVDEDQDQKEQLLGKLQENLDKLILNYDKTSLPSETKFITGLELIATRVKQEANKKALAVIKQNVESLKATLTQRLNEEDYAKNHLVSSPIESDKLEQQALRTKRNWEIKHKQLSTKESNFLNMSLLSSCDADEVKKQLTNLQGFTFTLEEATAHLHYIQSSLLASLSKILTQNFSDSMITTSSESLKEWKNSLDTLENSSDEWRKRLETIIQRNEQMNCLNDSAAPEGSLTLSEEFIQLSKKNLQLVSAFENELADTLFWSNVFQTHLNPLLGQHRQWLEKLFSFFSTGYVSFNEWIDHTLFYVGNYPVTLFALMRFFFILFLTFLIARLVVNALNTIGERRRGLQRSVLYKVNRLINYLILFIGTLVALSSIGFDFSNLLLLAGALGVGLGFGLQSIFNNFISGIIILFENNLKVGDLIELENGLKGDVRAINFRSTVIKTSDGVEALIPNAELVTSRVMNWTLNDPYRRQHIPFSIAYGEDKQKVAQLLIEAAKKDPMTLVRPGIPEPTVHLVKLGDNGLELELIVWIDDRMSRTKNVLSSYLWMIDTLFRENGITIPFPQREVRILSKNT